MGKNLNSKNKGDLISTGVVVALSVIYILVGLLLIMVPNTNLSYIFYGIGIVLLIFAIALIVRYLLMKSYQNIGNYEFSLGIACLAASICVLLKSSVLSSYLILFLGVCILIEAIIELQNAIDLRGIENPTWPVFMILALVFVVASLLIILNPGQWTEKHALIVYVLLFADGIFGLAGTVFVGISVKLWFKGKGKADNKYSNKKYSRNSDRSNDPYSNKYIAEDEDFDNEKENENDNDKDITDVIDGENEDI